MIVAMESMHVTLVGLDRYGHGVAALTNSDTRPSSVVVEYATWLQGRVDPENVFVFLSDIEDHDKDAVDLLLETGIPVDQIRNGTNDQIRKYCKNELAASPESNLFWVWCGHGFVYRGDTLRIVYCADTSTDDLRGFSVQDLENYLRDIKVQNLERQLLVWDTCAVGTDRHHGVNKAPAITKFKLPANCVQESHYAAEYELTAKTGKKSRAILEQLQSLPDDLEAAEQPTWPPNLLEPSDVWGDSGKQAVFASELHDYLGGDRDRIVVMVGGNNRERPLLNDTEIAEQMAESGERYYPFFDTHILSQVAEYLAQIGQPGDAIDAFRDACRLPPDNEDEVRALTELRMVADLPVDIFVTTSYDRTLSDLVKQSRGVEPIVASFGESISENPTKNRPLVYHLYGRVDAGQPRGVLTAITELQIRERNLAVVAAGTGSSGVDHPFPECVLTAIGDRRHLYVGFDLRDRVLRGLLHSLKCAKLGEGNEGFAIRPAFGQVRPKATEEDARAFLDRYMTEMGPCSNVKILWEFPSTTLAGVAVSGARA